MDTDATTLSTTTLDVWVGLNLPPLGEVISDERVEDSNTTVGDDHSASVVDARVHDHLVLMQGGGLEHTP